MDVGGTHGVAVQQGEEFVRGACLVSHVHTSTFIRHTIRGKRIGRRLQTVEMIISILVRAELPPQVVGLLHVGLLEVVLAAGRGLPDVDDGVGDGLLGDEVGDAAVHQGDLAAVRAAHDGVAVVAEGGVRRPEGAEDGGRGRDVVGLEGELVGDLVHQTAAVSRYLEREETDDLRLQAQDVRHAVRLVPGGAAGLADRVDELDAGHPLVEAEVDLAGKVVQVADEGGHDLAGSGGGLGADGVDDALGELGVVAGHLDSVKV